MKACLNCGTEYQNKRESSKFCSDKCRVKYNRTHPKPTALITPLQTQVLYNQVLEMLDRFGKSNENDFKGITAAQNGRVGATSHTTKQAQGEEPTFQEIMNGMEGLLFPDDKNEYAQKIRKFTHLTDKQKNLLLANLKH